MVFRCDYCDAIFTYSVGCTNHQRTCKNQFVPPHTGTSKQARPRKAPRLAHTYATAGRLQLAAPDAPPAGEQPSPVASQAAPDAQAGSPDAADLEPEFEAASPAASAATAATGQQPAAAACGDGAATRGIHLPSGEPFKVADVQQRAPPADDNDSEPWPASELSSKLTQRQARWLRVLSKLPRATQTEVLQLLADGPQGSDLPEGVRTPADVKRLVEDLAASEAIGGSWKKVQIEHKGRTYTVEHERDLVAVLRSFFADKEVASKLMLRFEPRLSADGTRLYTSFNTCLWWEQMEGPVKKWFAQNMPTDLPVVLFPYLFWSDGSQLPIGGAPFHNVNMMPANCPLEFLRSKRGFRHIARMPPMKAEPGLKSEHRQVVFTKAMSPVLDELKILAVTGVEMQTADGQRFLCVPLPAAFVADLPETASLLNVLCFPADFPDPNYMVHKDQLNSVHDEFDERTETLHNKVIAEAQQLDDEGAPHSAVAAKLKEAGLRSMHKSALSGFPWVNIFNLFHPETLHQDHQGIGRRLVRHLKRLLSPADFARVNQQLLQTEAFPGQTMHSEGFLGSNLTGHMANSMLQRLSAAVLILADHGALPSKELDNWLAALTLYLEWQACRDLTEHSAATVGELRRLRIRFQEHVLAHVEDGKNWCIPKFFNMRKYERLIMLLGNVEQLSSAPGERTNAQVKAHARFTNRHSSIVDQVMERVRHSDIIEHLIDSTTDDATPGTEERQTMGKAAKTTGKTAFPRRPPVASLVPLMPSKMGPIRDEQAPPTARSLKRLEEQSDLLQLDVSLPLYLANNPQPGTMLCDLPAPQARTVLGAGFHTLMVAQIKIADSAAVPYILHRGGVVEAVNLRATPHFGSAGGEPRFSNVAIRADGEVWMAQLRLLFVLTVEGEPRQLALVRWYEELPAAQLRVLEKAVRMSVLRWASIERDGADVDHYDVIDAEHVLGPVLLQQNPLRNDKPHFFHNHFVQHR